MRLTPSDVSIHIKLNKTFAQRQVVWQEPWSDIRWLSLEAAESTSSPLAIAAFGPLGLAARSRWMLLSIRFGTLDSTVGHLLKLTTFEGRQLVEAVHGTYLESVAKLRLGPPPNLPTRHSDSTVFASDDETEWQRERGNSGLISKLERAERMLREGTLTEEEFIAVKRSLLDSDE